MGSANIDQRITQRLKEHRALRAWSLEELAIQSGVSRATLSRIENGQVSPTTSVLAKLCAAYGLAMSHLIFDVEEQFAPIVRRDEQEVWTDSKLGFQRRSLSPPAKPLSGEVIECRLEAGAQVTYDKPSVTGLEHHLLLLEGGLDITENTKTHTLRPGDCLRYRLFGKTCFQASVESGAKYLLFIL